jgi:hypothetical protein
MLDAGFAFQNPFISPSLGRVEGTSNRLAAALDTFLGDFHAHT